MNTCIASPPPRPPKPLYFSAAGQPASTSEGVLLCLHCTDLPVQEDGAIVPLPLDVLEGRCSLPFAGQDACVLGENGRHLRDKTREDKMFEHSAGSRRRAGEGGGGDGWK